MLFLIACPMDRKPFHIHPNRVYTQCQRLSQRRQRNTIRKNIGQRIQFSALISRKSLEFNLKNKKTIGTRVIIDLRVCAF